MKCPVCNTIELRMAERQGVEIDYCPECRGVWLDRGELDKIIERSLNPASSQTCPPVQQVPEPGYYQQPVEYRQHDDHHYRQGGHHRKKSWLSELFD